jgi:hypothetical protein
MTAQPQQHQYLLTYSAHHLSHQDLWIIWEFMIYRFATLNLRIPGLKTGDIRSVRI